MGELPPIISSIKIVVVLSCKQFNKHWTAICDLSYNEPWISWPPTTLKKNIVDERIFDEVTNNKQDTLKSITFECHIEILSVTLFKLNNVHNLTITHSDTKYKNVWNKFIMDDNNIFMKKRQNISKHIKNIDQFQENEKKEYDEYNDSQYDLTQYDVDEDDEDLLCKKQDLIRMNILKSLDLTKKKTKR